MSEPQKKPYQVRAVKVIIAEKTLPSQGSNTGLNIRTVKVIHVIAQKKHYQVREYLKF